VASSEGMTTFPGGTKMTRTHLFSAAALAVAALTLASCGGSSSSSTTAAPSAASAPAPGGTLVRTAKTSLGTLLVDGGGRTLYAFTKDTGPKSMCAGACTSYWPPFTATSTPKAGGGVQASALKLVKRSDGSRQVAIDGHPLYFFKGDQSVGQLNGQGLDDFGAKWWVVSPSGSDVTSAPASSPSTSAPATPSYGY
jgi:predicted lipoprotein with Yx(FWY)xxD motif